MEANGIVLSAQARSNQAAAMRSDVHLVWLLMSGASFFFSQHFAQHRIVLYKENRTLVNLKANCSSAR